MENKTITIRINEEFYKKIKVHIAEKGIGLKEYLVALIEQIYPKKNKIKDTRRPGKNRASAFNTSRS